MQNARNKNININIKPDKICLKNGEMVANKHQCIEQYAGMIEEIVQSLKTTYSKKMEKNKCDGSCSIEPESALKQRDVIFNENLRYPGYRENTVNDEMYQNPVNRQWGDDYVNDDTELIERDIQFIQNYGLGRSYSDTLQDMIHMNKNQTKSIGEWSDEYGYMNQSDSTRDYITPVDLESLQLNTISNSNEKGNLDFQEENMNEYKQLIGACHKPHQNNGQLEDFIFCNRELLNKLVDDININDTRKVSKNNVENYCDYGNPLLDLLKLSSKGDRENMKRYKNSLNNAAKRTGFVSPYTIQNPNDTPINDNTKSSNDMSELEMMCHLLRQIREADKDEDGQSEESRSTIDEDFYVNNQQHKRTMDVSTKSPTAPETIWADNTYLGY